MSAENTNAVRNIELDADLQKLVKEKMSKKNVEADIAARAEKERAKFEERLAKKMERMKERMLDKSGEEQQIFVRKVLIRKNKDEIAALRDANKDLEKEMRALKPKRRRNKSTKETTNS